MTDNAPKFEVTYIPKNGRGISTTLITNGLVPFPAVQSEYVFAREHRDPYHIAITEAGEHLVLIMPCDGDKPGAQFTHPNIARTRSTTLEYKHYHKDGSKSWTSKEGVEHVLVVPRSQVQIKIDPNDLPYSYIPVVVNGYEITLNVSGGTGGGWTDWIYTVTYAFSNSPVKTFQAIAEVAVRGTAHEPFTFWDEKSQEEKNAWGRAVA